MINIKVMNCFKEKQKIEITNKSVVVHREFCHLNPENSPTIYFRISPKEYYYFYKEITNWNNFIHILLNNPYLLKHLIVIKLLPNSITPIDHKWSCITFITLMEKIEMEHLFSWLSTLGGGYSALGDQFTNCSKIAARISIKQLELCYKIGDPFMQARCKLFYSISLIQQGKLKLAKKIVREQYKFAKMQTVEDTRLIKMCQGIWLRLHHCYRIRHTH